VGDHPIHCLQTEAKSVEADASLVYRGLLTDIGIDYIKIDIQKNRLIY
jgi:hypothetical protein